MKSIEIQNSNGATDSCSVANSTSLGDRVNHGGQFIAARDSRNRRVPGLYTRNGRYYAALWADRGDGRKTTRRFPLVDDDGFPIRALTAAKDALVALRERNNKNALPKGGRKPSFDAFATEYLQMASTREKRARTQEKERDTLYLWPGHLG